MVWRSQSLEKLWSEELRAYKLGCGELRAYKLGCGELRAYNNCGLENAEHTKTVVRRNRSLQKLWDGVSRAYKKYGVEK